MSLPNQTLQLMQTARGLVLGLPADGLLVLTETPLDWDAVGKVLGEIKIFVAAENPALTRPLRDHPQFQVVQMEPEPLPIQERLNQALLNAVAENDLQPGSHIVVLYNGIATFEDEPEPIDSISVIHLGEHLERMTSSDLRILGPDIPMDVLRAVVDLATEIGREGREGQPVGTVIVVGDTRRVLKMSRFQNFNPFRGYTKPERDVRDRSVREQIKEIAKLDGAILITREGIAEAACVYLDVPSGGIDLAKGFGSRHLAAAGISRHTRAVAFCISQSSGTLRIFQEGLMKLHIEPLARPHVWQPFRLENREEPSEVD